LTLADERGGELRSLLGGPVDADQRDHAVSIVRSGDGIARAIERANAYADRGRASLALLPESPGVIGLSAAADYLLSNVEAAAAAV
jgi:geranylgeranyl pyrophosphate synthase